MSKFLLVLGPSGVGKSTLINELLKLDGRFTYISPYTTRSLREGEVNKVAVSDQQMDTMQERGKLLVVNTLYGIRYGTPRLPIVDALAVENFPILDWPISRLEVMTQAFAGQLFVAYVYPPSIDSLRYRLSEDQRDVDGARLSSALEELQKFESQEYEGLYDMKIVSEDGRSLENAMTIYDQYLKVSAEST